MNVFCNYNSRKQSLKFIAISSEGNEELGLNLFCFFFQIVSFAFGDLVLRPSERISLPSVNDGQNKVNCFHF